MMRRKGGVSRRWAEAEAEAAAVDLGGRGGRRGAAQSRRPLRRGGGGLARSRRRRRRAARRQPRPLAHARGRRRPCQGWRQSHAQPGRARRPCRKSAPGPQSNPNRMRRSAQDEGLTKVLRVNVYSARFTERGHCRAAVSCGCVAAATILKYLYRYCIYLRIERWGCIHLVFLLSREGATRQRGDRRR